jgi:predicted MFS family arabinose efflux permease
LIPLLSYILLADLYQTYFAASYYLALYAQAVLSYSPLKSGLFILPFEISLSISSATTGILVRLTGRYLELIYAGLALMVLSFGMFIHLDSHSSRIEMTLLQVFAGVGTVLSYPGPLLALQAQIARKYHATATSTLGLVRNLSAAISVVIGGVMFQNGMESQAGSLRAELGDSQAAKLSGKEAAAHIMNLGPLDKHTKEIVSAAYASALKRM